jgi:hypothetical protein
MLFNRKDPIGVFDLNLSSDYGLALSYDLLFLVANHPSYEFKTFSYSNDDGKTWEPFTLKKFGSPKPFITEALMREIDNEEMKISIANNPERVKEIFEQFDVDKSGELDRDEFKQLLISLGMNITESALDQIMTEIDFDGTGLLEIDEIHSYIRKIAKDAPDRIWSLQNHVQMTLAPEVTDKKSFHSIKNSNPNSVRYIPPSYGLLKIEVVDSFIRGDNSVVLSKSQVLCYTIALSYSISTNTDFFVCVNFSAQISY